MFAGETLVGFPLLFNNPRCRQAICETNRRGTNQKRTSKRLLPIRKHREERENGIASAVPFSHFSIDAVTFDISKAPMPL